MLSPRGTLRGDHRQAQVADGPLPRFGRTAILLQFPENKGFSLKSGDSTGVFESARMLAQVLVVV